MSEPPDTSADRTLSESQLPLPSSPATVTLSQFPGAAAPFAAVMHLKSTPGERIGRFEVQGEIGRGGMGAVLRGRDPTLGRDLAIKVLLTRNAENLEARRRFHEEAQIGGQLQHPGLVPVYELGTDADGRLFFAMKLVEGRTLTALLHERSSPADSQPRFLMIFEHVCQAVAYAHARGVIHRDLKPPNIMVGAFGEVQVMDWGLAKVLGSKTADDAGASITMPGDNTVRTARTASGGTESRDGSVMGSPAYLPPEQARGEIDQLDARADVFGLGAVLCEILTGKPPFTGDNVSAIIGRSAKGDLAETYARLAGCGADPELIALAKSCLAATASDRPANGAEVAARVAAYRAGVDERVHRAELDRTAAEVRAMEERRRRRMQLSLAGAVILLLTLGGAGGWLVWHQRVERRQDQVRHDAELREKQLQLVAEQAHEETDRVRQELNLKRAVDDDLNQLARAEEARQWDEAANVLARAEGRMGQGGTDDLRQRVGQAHANFERLRKDDEMVAKLEEARLPAPAAGESDVDGAGSRRRYEEAFAWYGLDVAHGAPDAVAARIIGSPIREELVLSLVRWGALAAVSKPAEGRRLWALADLADSSDWRRQLRGAIVRRDADLVRKLAGEAKVKELPPDSIAFLALALHIAREPQRALAILQQGRQHYPGDFWLNFELAVASAAQPGEALRYYTVAQALRPQSVLVAFNLGVTLQALGRWSEAAAAYREAGRLQPDSVPALNNLAFVLNELGQPVEAEAVCREVIRLKPDYPSIYQALGNALTAQGKLPQAADAFGELVRLRPGDPVARFNLANTFKALGKLPEAAAAFREAIRLKPDFPGAYCNLGFVLRWQGDFDASRDAFRHGHELGGMTPGWNYPSADWLREAEQLVDLNRRLPGVLDGSVKASPVEQFEFARVCGLKHWYAAAVRLFTDAFRADAALANDLNKAHRFNAARCAVLAAAGKDEMAKPPSEAERTRLRTQALEWLRTDLTAWGKRVEGGKPEDSHLVQNTLHAWQTDADLAAVRAADAIARLPEAERSKWREFWHDVDALLKRASAGK